MSESSTPDRPWTRRPGVRAGLTLAVLAYLPALTAAPGRMPSDSKLYLYLDPGRFFVDAASTFDARQFAGWVPHQHVAYLWPGTPWFWLFDALGAPDWIAHRLWIGTILVAAGLGVRWLARLLGLGPAAALAAAIVYQLTPYVLPYVSRTSVLLLPWAGLGWIVGFTVRAARRGGWADPAAVALVVVTVGSVNATALAMIVPAPVLWLVHAAWQRAIGWREAVLTGIRIGVLSTAVSLWWIMMLVIQGRYGTDVLPYSESLADVSLTATSPETWRSLGYWLFYVRDPAAPTTTESLRYLSSTPSIVVSYAIPLLALVALSFVSWRHRRFAALLIGCGLVLAVGVHPVDDRSPLMRLLAGGDDGLALALRSSTRALPVTVLGFALAVAMAVDAAGTVRPRWSRVGAEHAAAGVVALLAVVNLPALWTGGFVDPALERDPSPPTAWAEAAAALDASGTTGRVLQLPGAEFGAFRWGYTVDQPLPGLTDKPLVTRDLLPLGSTPAMDLLYALDDRVQDGVLEAASLAPVARLLGADTIWLTNDLAFDRFRTARPEVVRDVVARAAGVAAPTPYGDPMLNRPDVAMTDERAVGDPRVGSPMPVVELAGIADPGGIVRASAATLLVAGSGDGLVDAAAAELLDPGVAATRYTADAKSLPDAAGAASEIVGLVVTDSNRDRARHWRGSQDTTGFTETGGPDSGVLREVAADARLELFDSDDPTTQTIASQVGPATATATGYGEPFAYLPEHRPFMSIDGDPTTSWLVGEHGDPIGETLRLEFAEPVERITLHQPVDPSHRKITLIGFTGEGPGSRVAGVAPLDASSWDGTGQELTLGGRITHLDITIADVAGGVAFTGSAVAGVGFTEVDHGLGPTVETVIPPSRALEQADASMPLGIVLTRLRTDPMDRWRDDPEPRLVRSFALPEQRSFTVGTTVRIDARAPDAELASVFGWPVVADSRLTGSPRHAGVAAFDGDPATAWITGFGEAVGATLSMDSEGPLSSIEVRQPIAGFSEVTELTLRVGTDERRLALVPDAAGVSHLAVDPPLPSGQLTIEISDVDPQVTTDRRFGDPVELPAAVSEVVFDGRPEVEPIVDQRRSIDCAEIGVIDGAPVLATLIVADGGWLDGEPVVSEPCDPAIDLAPGDHSVEGRSALPVQLDRIVLDDGVRAALSEAALGGATAEVTASGRFDRAVTVTGCPDGCWLILGEGFNDAWSAAVEGVDLGAPTLVDGGFNGWWLPGSAGATTVDVRWTAQTRLDVALGLSTVAVIVCLALLIVGRRQPRGDDERARDGDCRADDDADDRVDPVRDVPHWQGDAIAPMTTRRTALVAIVWACAAAALIAPVWGLWGLVGGVALLVRRRDRIVELTALAALLVVAAGVVIRERRSAPLPNGGWPATFESFHELGMFAVVCVIVAAVAASDARPDSLPDTPAGSDAATHDTAGHTADDAQPAIAHDVPQDAEPA